MIPTKKQKRLLGGESVSFDRSEGKTTGLVLLALDRMKKHPQGLVVVLCPTLRQAVDVWGSAARGILSASPKLNQRYEVTGKGIRCSATRRELLVWASTEERIQGLHGEPATVLFDFEGEAPCRLVEQAQAIAGSASDLIYPLRKELPA